MSEQIINTNTKYYRNIQEVQTRLQISKVNIKITKKKSTQQDSLHVQFSVSHSSLIHKILQELDTPEKNL